MATFSMFSMLPTELRGMVYDQIVSEKDPLRILIKLKRGEMPSATVYSSAALGQVSKGIREDYNRHMEPFPHKLLHNTCLRWADADLRLFTEVLPGPATQTRSRTNGGLELAAPRKLRCAMALLPINPGDGKCFCKSHGHFCPKHDSAHTIAFVFDDDEAKDILGDFPAKPAATSSAKADVRTFNGFARTQKGFDFGVIEALGQATATAREVKWYGRSTLYFVWREMARRMDGIGNSKEYFSGR